MSGRCVIISGGEFCPIEGLLPDDFIIACDRGYTYARRCGIVPDLVVSDFDSYEGPIDPGVPVDRFRSEKDDTDTMIAIRHAVEAGYDEVLLYCALGGRLDHLLANLQSLVFAQNHGVRAGIVSPDTWICTLRDGTLRLPRREGWSLSLFAAQDHCEGVSITGAKYPLQDAVLTSGFPLGVSNEWADDAATVSVRSGILLIVLSKL
ncbi:MAG: thiamine diphosphokinase [Oscillospiraceae bacterium]|nr:thiamine diphosphokinase [Oscillospiraceae bacterium]